MPHSKLNLDQIDQFNQKNRNNGSAPIDNATMQHYIQLAEKDDDCTSSLLTSNLIPEDGSLASNEFGHNVGCFVQDVKAGKKYGLLHDIIQLSNTKPLKKDRDVTVHSAMLDHDPKHDLFIVKNQPYTDLVIEYLVGRYGTNTLRNWIPNFAMVYGLLKCSSLVGDMRETGSWCQEGNPTNGYIVYENVRGMTLHQYIRSKPDPKDLLLILVQLFLALGVAHRILDFTHYDLHTNNIIVHTLNTPIEVSYPIGNKSITLKVNTIPVIIDFGFSHIKYRDGDKVLDFGVSEYKHASINADRSSLMYDIYRVLIATLTVPSTPIRKYLEPMWNIIIEDSVASTDKYDYITYLPEQLQSTILPYDEFMEELVFIYWNDLKAHVTTNTIASPIKYPSQSWSWLASDSVDRVGIINDTIEEVANLEYDDSWLNRNTLNTIANVIRNKDQFEHLSNYIVKVAKLEDSMKQSMYYMVLDAMDDPILRKTIMFAYSILKSKRDAIVGHMDRLSAIKLLFIKDDLYNERLDKARTYFPTFFSG